MNGLHLAAVPGWTGVQVWQADRLVGALLPCSERCAGWVVFLAGQGLWSGCVASQAEALRVAVILTSVRGRG